MKNAHCPHKYGKAYGFASVRRRSALLRRAVGKHPSLPNPTTLYRGNPNREEIIHLINDLAGNLSGYPRVTAMLYKIRLEKVEVVVIAQRPMTRPIGKILESWSERMSHLFPEKNWVTRSIQLPPRNVDSFQSVAITVQ